MATLICLARLGYLPGTKLFLRDVNTVERYWIGPFQYCGYGTGFGWSGIFFLTGRVGFFGGLGWRYCARGFLYWYVGQ